MNVLSTADKIRIRRIELGLTQADLAFKLGYSNGTIISNIENGHTKLPKHMIEKFELALEIKLGK